MAWADNGGYIADATGIPDVASFEDSYRGCWPSFSDYLADEIEAMQIGWPEEPVRYFDADAYERDRRYDFTVLDDGNGDVYVFAEW
ncbi:MAG: hypothetical protein KH427_02035 [Actinomycetaceae bacterium]|nr:hypothetical protein [Actinomycetaceae bacterium]